MKMSCIPRANTVLHFVNHSCASSSETLMKLEGSGIRSLQLDCESLLLLDIDLINVEPSEHILGFV